MQYEKETCPNCGGTTGDEGMCMCNTDQDMGGDISEGMDDYMDDEM